MSDEAEDLRATAEDLIESAEKVVEIEQRKLEMAPDDPQMVGLATESERLVREMVPKAAAETELAQESAPDQPPTG